MKLIYDPYKVYQHLLKEHTGRDATHEEMMEGFIQFFKYGVPLGTTIELREDVISTLIEMFKDYPPIQTHEDILEYLGKHPNDTLSGHEF